MIRSRPLWKTAVLVVAASPTVQAQEVVEPTGESLLSGTLSLRHRERWTSFADDHDLFATLSLDYGDPSRDSATFHLLGRLAGDLDGRPEADGEYSFFSLSDLSSSRLSGWLYHGFVEFHSVAELDRLRLGRQTLYDAPVFAWFDGLSGESAPVGSEKWRFGAYAGIPVRPFEASPSGDALGGCFVAMRPWERARGRLDWMHFEDSARFGARRNDLWSLRLWQGLGDHVQVDGRFTGLEGRRRDIRVGGTYLDPESTFTMRVSHYVLLEPQGELVGELDPFVQSLHTFYPYAQTRLSLSKFFGERLAAEGGIDLRRVDESADVGSFNRNFERAYLSAHLLDIGASGIDLSLTAESWQGASNDIDTWGVDLSKEVKEGWELSVGSAFSLFKYDLYMDAERFDVRSTFARLRFEVSEEVRIELRYEIEDDGVDSYQELNVRTTWSF